MINTEYTYILWSFITQSNWASRATVTQMNTYNYAPYSNYTGLTNSTELRGGSTNNVYCYYDGNYQTQATMEKYGRRWMVTSSYDVKLPRGPEEINPYIVIAPAFRAAMDAAGNDNDLYLLHHTVGGIGVLESSGLHDLNADTLEMTYYNIQTLRKLIEQLQSEGKKPYVIAFDCQGENDSGNIPQAMLNRTAIYDFFYSKLLFYPPTVAYPIGWHNRSYLDLMDVWVNGKSYIHWGYGNDSQEFADAVIAADVGNPNELDQDVQLSYTIDGTHFNAKVLVQYGLLSMPKIIELADGYIYP